ncbi:MAG: sigma-54-dependent Fis family transcriptional regulator [Betaproteobacteria bacterium RIFCSPLOWO2_02_FULL_65_20]|nr:MAG: sigma-54-dependent Fis family transcriptional regulator [Betaproteobacteria bacterium RIFCSPLOWO2_02_FULL_65_20]
MAGSAVTRRPERPTAGVNTTVLVVDDEADIRELLELSLVRMGLGVESAGSVAEAKALLQRRRFDLCLTDMRLPDGDGLDLVRHIGEHCDDLPVAVITAYGSMENAVSALKAGAFDYLTKPLSLDQLRTLVRSALSLPQKEEPGRQHVLLGDGPGIQQVRLMIDKLARSQAPIYITGESGSGKELAARLIHEQGARRDRPLVPVNCGAIPETLMESEFFGYRKGAFTGAESDREGFFHVANGGTLFLDEVADLPLAMQVKLLRAIQEKRVRKIGATTEDPVDVRIICATHQNLSELVAAEEFRQDLYYRLAVIELRMPPLRECREDIPVLAGAILARLAPAGGAGGARLSEGAREALQRYDFPGNARELENILERAVALAASDEILPDDLQLAPPACMTGEPRVADAPNAGNAKWPLQEYLDQIEREAILEALDTTRFNRTAAAKLLGITFRALRYRMERLRIR